MAEGLSPCGVLVRDGDHDRFLTVLVGGGARAEDLFALYAFNLELARTSEVVREALLGEIRLQWWRDTLAAAAEGRPPHHPVAEGLAAALQAGHLERGSLERLIEARRADLDGEPPPDLEGFVGYAEATAGQLNRMAAETLGLAEEEGLLAAQQIGTAWGLVGLLRATAFWAQQGRVLLPGSLLAQAGVSNRDVVEGRRREAVGEVARAVGAAAAERLAAARLAVPTWPKGSAGAFLLAGLTDHYLKRLRAVGWDLYDGRLRLRPPGRAWRLAWHKLRGRT